jgi:hypothetical protein
MPSRVADPGDGLEDPGRRRRSGVAGPFAAAVALLALVVLAGFLPWLLRERPAVSSTPIVRPPAVVAELQLRPGSRACVSEVLFTPEAEEVKVQVTRARRDAGPPLAVAASAAGYRARAVAPGGYGPRQDLEVALPPAGRQVDGGRLCLRNAGRTDVWLLGTVEERALATQRTTLDGAPAPVQLAVTLQERENRSLLARTGELLDRAAVFRPGYLAPPVLWLLLAAVVLAVPAAVLVALRRALDEDGAR